MNTRRDWQDAREALLEQGRKQVGPPPDVEKVEALLRGDLPEAEAQRMREILAYYPELVRAMTADAPAEGEEILTDAEREADFARMRQRLGLRSPVAHIRPIRRQRRSRVFALAAAILVTMAISGVAVMRWRQESRPAVTKVLIADTDRIRRGPSSAPATVLTSGTDYLVKPLYRPARAFREYRLELFDLNITPRRTLWTRNGIELQPDGSFPVRLSTENLAPGRYELVLYGIDGETSQLATYTLWVAAR